MPAPVVGNVLFLHVFPQVSFHGSDHISKLISQRCSTTAPTEWIIKNPVIENILLFEKFSVLCVHLLILISPHLSSKLVCIRLLFGLISIELCYILRVEASFILLSLWCLERRGVPTDFASDPWSWCPHLRVVHCSFWCPSSLMEVRSSKPLTLLDFVRNFVTGFVVQNKAIVALVRFLDASVPRASAFSSLGGYLVLNMLFILVLLEVSPPLVTRDSSERVIESATRWSGWP